MCFTKAQTRYDNFRTATLTTPATISAQDVNLERHVKCQMKVTVPAFDFTINAIRGELNLNFLTFMRHDYVPCSKNENYFSIISKFKFVCAWEGSRSLLITFKNLNG